MGQSIILVGSWEAVNELFGKRGNIYSNRPPFPFPEIVSVNPLFSSCSPNQSPVSNPWFEKIGNVQLSRNNTIQLPI